MTQDEFNQLRSELNARCEELLDCKGQDYTDGKDRLHNFRTIAQEAGISALQAWHVYAYKHWKSICNFVRNGQVQSESIETRFQDLRNYLDLGYALLKDAEPPENTIATGLITFHNQVFPTPPLPPPLPPEFVFEKVRSGYSLKKAENTGSTGRTGSTI